jgi:hypothetical protein
MEDGHGGAVFGLGLGLFGLQHDEPRRRAAGYCRSVELFGLRRIVQHHGGKTPMQTFEDLIPLAKEKLFGYDVSDRQLA